MRDARRKASPPGRAAVGCRAAALAAGVLVIAGAGLPLPRTDAYGTAAAAAQAPPAPVNNVLPLLAADKPIFGQFVNYLGVAATGNPPSATPPTGTSTSWSTTSSTRRSTSRA